MLADLVADVVGSQRDMSLETLRHPEASLSEAAAAARADVVVVQAPDGRLPSDCRRLFMTRPRVRVIGVAENGRRAYVWQLYPQRTSLGELAPRGLIAAIRGVVRATVRAR